MAPFVQRLTCAVTISTASCNQDLDLRRRRLCSRPWHFEGLARNDPHLERHDTASLLQALQKEGSALVPWLRLRGARHEKR
jgi:hypothetical protein